MRDNRLGKNLVSYLEMMGWKLSPDTNERWNVLWGESDIEGEPLEIILPKNLNAGDYPIYLDNTLNLLAALKNESLFTTITRIIHYLSDVLSSRNLDTGGYNSIPLRYAANLVDELKMMVFYSACSEREPKPYFLTGVGDFGKKMVDQYRFGHTFAGSFGLTIESPIVHMPIRIQQLPLFDGEPPKPLMPIERRVMERIARGLLITKAATDKLETDPLINEYASGFNGNMCNAIVNMSQHKQAHIEYSIQWSPKYESAEDVSSMPPIQLTERSYNYLEFAAEKLKVLKPEYVTLRGRIIGLSAKDNPLGTNTDRFVIVRGKVNENKRHFDVSIELNAHDYVEASHAHLEWVIVQVNGLLSRSGYAWRLSDYQNFQIIRAQ